MPGRFNYPKTGPSQRWLINLVAVIISNGALQSAVNTWLLGSTLRLHPLVVFLVTIAAGVLGGLLAMVLAVPLTAVVVQTKTRLQAEGVIGVKEELALNTTQGAPPMRENQ